MQNTIRILIVEDDLLIAQDLHEILEEVGYQDIFKARNYTQAVELLQSENIDLALLDIHLNDAHTGIDLANYINANFKIPFIFITSYADANTITGVKETRPAGFLLKPYSKELLLAKIEISLFNYSHKYNAAEESISTNTATNETDLVINNHLLIKDNYRFIKVPLKEILWLESDKNYIDIKTVDRKYKIRSSLKKLLEELPDTAFIKCHKEFIINVNHIEHFNTHTVSIAGNEIPIGRSMQEEVLKKIKQ